MDLSSLKTNANIAAIDTDYVGGSRILPSAIYNLTIKLAYITVSSGGAMALNVEVTTQDGKTVNETTYMTSKAGKNTYINKKTGDEAYLPGFLIANSLALLTVGEEIGDLETEEKVINLYNYDLKKDVPTKVQMFTSLVGTEVIAAIEQQLVDKSAKNEAGVYVATGETREQNEIVKYFRSRDSMTVTEITAQAEEAAFIHIWTEKNAGNIRDKSTKTGVSSGAPAAAGKNVRSAASGGVKSLFA